MIEPYNSKNLLDLHSILRDKYPRYQMLVLTLRGAYAAQEKNKKISVALDRDASKAANLLKAHFMNGLEHTLATMLANLRLTLVYAPK